MKFDAVLSSLGVNAKARMCFDCFDLGATTSTRAIL